MATTELIMEPSRILYLLKQFYDADTTREERQLLLGLLISSIVYHPFVDREYICDICKIYIGFCQVLDETVDPIPYDPDSIITWPEDAAYYAANQIIMGNPYESRRWTGVFINVFVSNEISNYATTVLDPVDEVVYERFMKCIHRMASKCKYEKLQGIFLDRVMTTRLPSNYYCALGYRESPYQILTDHFKSNLYKLTDQWTEDSILDIITRLDWRQCDAGYIEIVYGLLSEMLDIDEIRPSINNEILHSNPDDYVAFGLVDTRSSLSNGIGLLHANSLAYALDETPIITTMYNVAKYNPDLIDFFNAMYDPSLVEASSCFFNL